MKIEPQEMVQLGSSGSSLIDKLKFLHPDSDCSSHDMTIITSDKKIMKCHRVVLAAASSKFLDLINTASQEDEDVVIIAENMTQRELEVFLKFLYFGKVKMNKVEFKSLLTVIQDYKIKNVDFSPNIHTFDNEMDISHLSERENLFWTSSFNKSKVGSFDIEESLDVKIDMDETLHDERSPFLYNNTKYAESDEENYLKKKVQCEYCKKEFKDNRGKASHLRTSSCQAALVGNDIGVVQTSPREMSELISENDSDEEYSPQKMSAPKKRKYSKKTNSKKKIEFQCDYCEIKCKSIINMRDHVNTDHKPFFGEFLEKYQVHECQRCKQKFFNKTTLGSHEPKCSQGVLRGKGLLMPDGFPNNKRRKCPHCSHHQKTYEQWSDHVKTHILGKKHISCEKCDFKCSLNKTLRKHAKLHEKSECPILCNLCGQTSDNQYDFDKHSQLHHKIFAKNKEKVSALKNDVGDFLCKDCGKQFTSKARYSYHTTVFHMKEEDKITCSYCNLKAINQKQLQIHMLLHFPPTHPCPDCGKKFHKKYYLNRHIRAQHTPDQLKRFMCTQCGKGFDSESVYEGHINMHAGLKPYRCRYCSQSYQNLSNCLAHEKKRHADVYVKKRQDCLSGISVKSRMKGKVIGFINNGDNNVAFP